jgi:hypothetical protein
MGQLEKASKEVAVTSNKTRNGWDFRIELISALGSTQGFVIALIIVGLLALTGFQPNN